MSLKLLKDNPESRLVEVEDEGGNIFHMYRTEFRERELKEVLKEQKRLRVYKLRPNQKFTPSPALWPKVVEILKNDLNFKMPISSPPDDEEIVLALVGDNSGTTVASDRKLCVSYDVIYSTNQELENLLEKMGVVSRPFFNSDVIRLAHGPRMDFYMALLDSGFEPSKLGE